VAIEVHGTAGASYILARLYCPVRGIPGLLALGACLLLAPSAGRSAQPVFRGTTDVVSLTVTVVDRDGRAVRGLTASDFEVREDGAPQAIGLFARAEQTDVIPLHLGLMLDTSGSMDRDIDLARTAAIRFFNRLGEAEDVTLVAFSTEVRVTKYRPADFPRLVERIRLGEPEGMTALHDALGVYLDGASAGDGRTVLVLYTDGGDTRSAMSYREVLDLVRASDVTIYVVGFLERLPSRERFEQQVRLQRLAGDTGGIAVFPLSMRDVEAAYDRIAAEIRGHYTLGYISTDTTADGRWRDVEVRVRQGGVNVRSRRGYFAPYRPDLAPPVP